MWIVAIGWAYVVILMAATETSVIAGIMTFFRLLRATPVYTFLYHGGGKAARASRRRIDLPNSNVSGQA